MVIDEIENKYNKKTFYKVIKCTKCGEFTYGKVTQKGKKCTRCGRHNVMSEIKGIVVEGVTAAQKKVVELQHEKFGHSAREFSISTSKFKTISFKPQNTEDEENNRENLENKKDLDIYIDFIRKWQKNESINENSGFPTNMLQILYMETLLPYFNSSQIIMKLQESNKFKKIGDERCYIME